MAVNGKGCLSMGKPMVEIDELVLRVPGYNENDGRILGQEVVGRVAAGLTDQQRDNHIESLDLKVNVPDGISKSEMAKLISEAILKGLI